MEVAASTIAFGQAIKGCVRIGHEMVQRYKAYKRSNEQVGELLLIVEKTWLKAAVQLELLDKIKDDLDSRLLACFNACLERLEHKLHLARAEIETLTTRDSSKLSLEKLTLDLPKFKKLRYSAFESHIRATVSELEKWHAEFDPSWLFILRLQSDRVDTALTEQIESTPQSPMLQNVRAVRAVLRDIEDNRQSSVVVFKDSSFISSESTHLVGSNVALAVTSTSAQEVLVDTTDYPAEADADDVKRQVRNLARILMQADPPTIGLLQCLGVLKLGYCAGALQKYQLIYSIPPHVEQPTSLRHLFSEPMLSLDSKFSIARAIARGVASVHAAGFVHKNIRPETVLTFREKQTTTSTAFLVGFERFRGVHEVTTLTGDMVWWRNLYRHPQRQGRHPDQMYQMQHDIYSLGVCLLEIGLWRSFVLLDPPRPGILLNISTELENKNTRQAALEIKKKLLELAIENLPATMGLVYADVVVSCLTCLDPDAQNMFANSKDLRDHDGILVGMAFIEKVMTKLYSVQLSEQA